MSWVCRLRLWGVALAPALAGVDLLQVGLRRFEASVEAVDRAPFLGRVPLTSELGRRLFGVALRDDPEPAELEDAEEQHGDRAVQHDHPPAAVYANHEANLDPPGPPVSAGYVAIRYQATGSAAVSRRSRSRSRRLRSCQITTTASSTGTAAITPGGMPAPAFVSNPRPDPTSTIASAVRNVDAWIFVTRCDPIHTPGSDPIRMFTISP